MPPAYPEIRKAVKEYDRFPLKRASLHHVEAKSSGIDEQMFGL
jgi:hypothetical protein